MGALAVPWLAGVAVVTALSAQAGGFMVLLFQVALLWMALQWLFASWVAVPYPWLDAGVSVLAGIAQEAYGDASLFLRIFAANRNQLSDPNLIFPGRPLRVPMGNRI